MPILVAFSDYSKAKREKSQGTVGLLPKIWQKKGLGCRPPLKSIPASKPTRRKQGIHNAAWTKSTFKRRSAELNQWVSRDILCSASITEFEPPNTLHLGWTPTLPPISLEMS